MSDWERRRLKFVVRINQRKLPETTPTDAEFRYIDIGSVGRGRLTAPPELTTFALAPSRARRLVSPGDVIVSTVRTYLRAVWPVAGPTDDLVVSTGFAVLSPKAGLSLDYLGWLVQADPFVEEVVARSVGVSYPAINPSEIGDIAVTVPPLDAQRRIATRLTAQMQDLDRLLEKEVELVGVLLERRKLLITDAVLGRLTGGSGDAIARQTRPLRAMAQVALGRQRSPEHAVGPHMVRYLRAANVKDGVLDLEDVMSMNFTPSEQVTFALQPGDVLITEGAGSLTAVGANAVWRGELDETVCFQNTLLRLRPRPGNDARFLSWWARYAYESGLLAAIATGANIYHLGAARVRTLRAWIPDIETQREIADLLDAETTRIESLIRGKRRMIELLLERRQTLITASVTGQLKQASEAA